MVSSSSVLYFKKLSVNAFPPEKFSKESAGFDFRSAYNYKIEPHGKELIKTDLAIRIPDGCYGRIAPRSGLALKHHIDIGAGVVDRDYRGNVGVIIFNHSSVCFTVQKGDRIAQIICEKIEEPKLREVLFLDNTERGENGFGSTGGTSVSDDNKTKELLLEIDKFLAES